MSNCPNDPDFEHRATWPYLGSCVPKDLSERTGQSKKYRQTWDANFPNAHAKTPGMWVWDGGCDKAISRKTP